MVYHGTYAVLLALHLVAVVFVIGPLAIAVMTGPRLLRGGAAGLLQLRAALRASRLYSYASIVIVLLGTAMIRNGPIGRQWAFSDTWVSVSYALWLASVLLVLFGAGPALADGIEAIEGGGEGGSFAGRVAASGGLATLCWLAIIVLMVTKPGT